MSFQVRTGLHILLNLNGITKNIFTDDELTKFVEVEETRYNEHEIRQHYKYR